MLRPTQDYILVRPLERQQSKTIAVVSYEKHCRGEVLAVGPGKHDKKGRLHPLDAKPGDIIAFGDGNFDFYPKHYDGLECLRIIQEADIVGILEDEPSAVRGALLTARNSLGETFPEHLARLARTA
jgi:chaperonin GroES